ncbi:uncharacterized protein [Asterias amurensis]|uniref:uncharacterized protein n=1 Tax=Asterias amurensis TaxID=7602 RepID=UPI003AB5E585
MTRSVKDLRELICVSRLTMRDSDDEGSDDDLSRPISSLSIFGEPSTTKGSSNVMEALNGLSIASRPSYVSKSVRPKSQQSNGAQRKKPTSSSSLNSNNSSSQFQSFKTPLPPLASSRPSSGSSVDSDCPGSGQVKSSDSGNFDEMFQYIDSDVVVEWLGRANSMVSALGSWYNTGNNFVTFANFWLTEFPEAQRLDLIHMEVGILQDELSIVFDKGLKQQKVSLTDLDRLIRAILREYPGRICSARGTHVFLNILETLSSERTEQYKRLLTDVKISTRNRDYAQWMLAIRAFLLLSVWSNIVNFYRRFKSDDPESEPGAEDQSSIDGVQLLTYQAVQHGFVSVLHYLSSQNEKLDLAVVDKQDRSLVFEAVMHNQPRVLHYLLKKACPGLDVNRSSSSGNTPLHSAANWGFTEVVQILLDKGQAQVNCANPNCDNATPLHLAVMQGHTSVCRLLLDAGADAKATMNGITPTQLAQDMGHTDILLLLSRKQIEDEDMES